MLWEFFPDNFFLTTERKCRILKQISVRPLTAEKRIQADPEFHIAIARAGGNKLLELLLKL
jgi:DNA-binding FadR family transcriptional regulator